jgi:hypothetical protein
MHLNWIVIALPFASLLYCVWVICRLRPTAHFASQMPASLSAGTDLRTFPRSRRTIKWMSPGEFESIIGKFQDVIFIDLLPKCSDRSRPFPEAHFLFIEPDEFHDVLRWAPRSSCVVLYGRSNFCKSMILAARDIAGHAPIFVLAVES